ncbi:MAG: DUF3991 and TOPRIM domain-containing protein [Methylococcales bacterium]|nr:DUF3991 and TOPRIM domain-containing protein [Methylococcales bacterium]
MNIEELRQLDLLAVCLLLGLEQDPSDKKQFKGEGFRICVTGFKWYDHHAQKGGGGAIDLTMHVKNLSFGGACSFLGGAGELPTAPPNTTKTPKETATKPPEADNAHLPAVMAYLTKRGLNADLVRWCFEKGLIYADSRRNCVFRYGTIGAELRGTGAVQWRSVYGTIEQGFILPAAAAEGVAVLESAIDALSYRQLHRHTITVSIAGNSNRKAISHAVNLAKSKNLPVLSAFDNDQGGNIANDILNEYGAKFGVNVIQDRPTASKDWNEALLKSAGDQVF